MNKNKLLFTQVDMNQNGAALSLVNFLNKLNFDKYEAEILIIKECEENVISLLPKEVKVTYLYKNHPVFDNSFFKGIKEAKEKKLLYPFIVNKIFKNNKEKHIKKLKISLRKSWVPQTEYDVAVSFDEQSFRYLKKVNAKKKIVRYAYGEVITKEDPNNKPYNFADYVIAQCNGLKEDLIAKNKADENKIVIIHNIFDNDKIIEMSKEFSVPCEKKYIFTTVSRIVPIKRIDLIPLVAKCMIDANYDNFIWYIIGNPEKEKYMEPFYKNLKETHTENHVKLLGKLDNPYPYVKASNAYVQLSSVDAWPRTIMEAMILQVPVIATKTKGAIEQIENEVTGLLMDINTPPILIAERMIHIMHHGENYKKHLKNFRVNNEEIMESYYKLF